MFISRRRRQVGFDSSASAFFAAAGTSPAYQSAFNTFVVTIKGAGIWDKCSRIYPFDPTSETASQYELKTALSEITYVNSPVWATTGVTCDGTTNLSYMTTTFDPNSDANITANSVHLCGRLTNDQIGLEGLNSTIVGVQSGSVPIQRASIDFFSGAVTARGRAWSNTSSQYAQNASYDQYQGLWFMSRISSTDIKLYVDNVQVGTSAVANTGTKSNGQVLYIGANNSSGSPTQQMSATVTFASIGQGLTSGEISTMTTAINTLQAALGR